MLVLMLPVFLLWGEKEVSNIFEGSKFVTRLAGDHGMEAGATENSGVVHTAWLPGLLGQRSCGGLS